MSDSIAVGAQPLVDGVADEVEREEDVLAAELRRDVEAEDVGVLVAGRDGGETLRAELRFEHRIDAGIVRLHDHDAVLEHELDRLVVARHGDTERAVGADAESRDELVAVVVRELVDAPASDAELVAKVRGDGLPDLLDREARRFRVLDLFEGAFDLGEEAFVVHGWVPRAAAAKLIRRYRFTRSARRRAMRSFTYLSSKAFISSMSRNLWTPFGMLSGGRRLRQVSQCA